MLNLSIMPLDTEHLDLSVEDIINQQRSGATTHAMFMMKFNAEGTPPVDKATKQCKKYDLYRSVLDKVGAKHGVLVQATLGHITTPSSPYPFQPAVSLVTGEERVSTCCPLDPDFRKYIKGQFRILAEHRPSMVMIDDDLGLLYRREKGCACKYHMAEFNRRAGTDMTREELYLHTQGTSDEDKRLTDLYVDVQRDGIVGCVKAMREGLDEVDPKIQGIVSGIYTSTFCEFSDYTAEAFAGEGNPRIMRLNGGPYSNSISNGGLRFFTDNMYRAAVLKETTKHKVDVFLAETDTCPQNRYSTSASLLHAHFTASILEGATGAKHWITRLASYEPNSGIAYRKKLSKYSKFYERLTEFAKDLKPFGCRIPLSKIPNYQFVESSRGEKAAPWGCCVLERLGLPLYYSNEKGGAVFLDEYEIDRFDDSEIEEFLLGTAVLSAKAAEKLEKRGFVEMIGVRVADWQGKVISLEIVDGKSLAAQYGRQQLIPIKDGVEELSWMVHTNASTGEYEKLFPAVTSFKNSLGGRVIVFSGTPNMPFKYFTAFSLLCETRKKQFVNILGEDDLLPVYYTEDAEVYLRAGYLPGGEIMAAVFNLSLDGLEDIPLYSKKALRGVEYLNERGEREPLGFTEKDGVYRIKMKLPAATPAILFLK